MTKIQTIRWIPQGFSLVWSWNFLWWRPRCTSTNCLFWAEKKTDFLPVLVSCYHPPTKLREGSVFSCGCPSLNRAPTAPALPPWTLDLTVHAPHGPHCTGPHSHPHPHTHMEPHCTGPPALALWEWHLVTKTGHPFRLVHLRTPFPISAYIWWLFKLIQLAEADGTHPTGMLFCLNKRTSPVCLSRHKDTRESVYQLLRHIFFAMIHFLCWNVTFNEKLMKWHAAEWVRQKLWHIIDPTLEKASWRDEIDILFLIKPHCCLPKPHSWNVTFNEKLMKLRHAAEWVRQKLWHIIDPTLEKASWRDEIDILFLIKPHCCLILNHTVTVTLLTEKIQWLKYIS